MLYLHCKINSFVYIFNSVVGRLCDQKIIQLTSDRNKIDDTSIQFLYPIQIHRIIYQGEILCTDIKTIICFRNYNLFSVKKIRSNLLVTKCKVKEIQI